MQAEPQIPPRWYMVSRYGGATLCIDEADALYECKKADMEYATHAPHVAVQLAPVRPLNAAPTDGLQQFASDLAARQVDMPTECAAIIAKNFDKLFDAEPSEQRCTCDGGSFEVKRHPFIVNRSCTIHGDAAPSEPRAEHWRAALYEAREFQEWITTQQAEWIEQRARELAKEGK